MADYIKKIRTSNGDKQIDYEALANLPTIPLVDMSLTNEGAAADAKATGDAINLVNTRVEEKVENPLTGVVGQILEIETVDESGKPKTYKAVNKPSGGGEVTDEQISNAVDNYMTAHPFTETDPTVPDWAKHPEKPRYTAEEVGADASGTAQSKVSEHNVSDTAHNDIRLLIDGLTTRLNALADSDDTTLDQMAEVVAYIKNNKSLIDGITTSKVNVSDIIDNLTTSVSNKPLSAKQGVQLKALIDAIVVPTKTSQLQNDSNFVTKDVTDSLENEKVDYTEVDSIVETAVENEKGNIVQLIIDELQGLPVFGTVDENNVVTITNQLSSGTYTLKYEYEDGTTADVGTITIGGGSVVIVNLLESALTPNDITTVFNGVGYMNGYYASAAEPFYNTDSAFFCAGLMPIPESKVFYVKGCTFDTALSHTRFGFMKEDGSTINTAVLSTLSSIITLTELGEQYYSIEINTNVQDYEDSYYFYFSASGTGNNVIVATTPIE